MVCRKRREESLNVRSLKMAYRESLEARSVKPFASMFLNNLVYGEKGQLRGNYKRYLDYQDHKRKPLNMYTIN